MKNDCPIVSVSRCASSRAAMSGAPPGGIVTSTFTGRVGYCCAWPSPHSDTNASTARPIVRNFIAVLRRWPRHYHRKCGREACGLATPCDIWRLPIASRQHGAVGAHEALPKISTSSGASSNSGTASRIPRGSAISSSLAPSIDRVGLEPLDHAEIAAGERRGDGEIGIGVGRGHAVLDAPVRRRRRSARAGRRCGCRSPSAR